MNLKPLLFGVIAHAANHYDGFTNWQHERIAAGQSGNTGENVYNFPDARFSAIVFNGGLFVIGGRISISAMGRS